MRVDVARAVPSGATDVEPAQVAEGCFRHIDVDARGALHGSVVDTDNLPVAREPEIAFDAVGTLLKCEAESCQGIFGGVVRGPAMADDEGSVHSCVK